MRCSYLQHLSATTKPRPYVVKEHHAHMSLHQHVPLPFVFPSIGSGKAVPEQQLQQSPTQPHDSQSNTARQTDTDTHRAHNRREGKDHEKVSIARRALRRRAAGTVAFWWLEQHRTNHRTAGPSLDSIEASFFCE